MSKELPRVFGYYVNLDERGEFNADLRDLNDKSIAEVSSDPEDGTIWQVESGYMKHGRDLNGLKDYLVSVDILKVTDKVLPMADFERVQARYLSHTKDSPNQNFEI